MTTFFVVLLALVLAGMLIGLPFFLKWLAEGNTLFTTVPEGTAKAAMKSKTLDHVVMSLKGSHLNKPGSSWYDESIPDWEVVENVSEVSYEDRNFLSRWLGIYYVGIPPFRTVYTYRFAWNEMSKKEDGTKKVWSRDERTDFIYVVAFPYVFIVDEAETDDNLPVDVQIQATVRVVNPYKALFDTENWMEVVSGALIAATRNFVGSKDYADLVSESRLPKGGTDTSGGDRLCTPVLKLNDTYPDGSPGLHGRYGVIIESVDILRVDIAGERKAEILDATVQRYTADQKAYTTSTLGKAEAEATLAKGTASAKVIELEGVAKASAIENAGLAEAKALTARLAAWNGGGTLNALIAQMEAMGSQGPGKTVIWANNPFVQKFNGLAEALDTLGIKSLDELKEYFGKSGTESEEKTA